MQAGRTEQAEGSVLMFKSVNQATKGVLGCALTSSGVPSCWILPLHAWVSAASCLDTAATGVVGQRD